MFFRHVNNSYWYESVRSLLPNNWTAWSRTFYTVDGSVFCDHSYIFGINTIRFSIIF